MINTPYLTSNMPIRAVAQTVVHRNNESGAVFK